MTSLTDDPPHTWRSNGEVAALTCLLILAACLLGILTRPIGHLASLWPANALLLGALVCFPRLANPAGWSGALAGYLLADLIAGSSLLHTLLLTACNLAGVIAGYLLLTRLDAEHRRLRTPLSVPYLVLAITLASATAGVFGAIVDPLLFDGDPISGWTFWFTTELVNFMLILPVLLTLPPLSRRLQERRHRAPWTADDLRQALPALSLLFSCLLCLVIGGPGALAFPVPALLWCALTYSVFKTALLTLLANGWVLMAIALGELPLALLDMNSRPALQSLRLGISLMALAPLTVASVMAARNELLQRMQYLATHDQLSGLLNRWAFREQANLSLEKLGRHDNPAALLMLDLDHFKRINDRHGHASGDQVLKTFAQTASLCLREKDVLARIGGEEFALLLPDCTSSQAQAIAERIRSSFAGSSIELADKQRISCSVSIGAVITYRSSNDLDNLLLLADQALYQAKELGRNRVEIKVLAQVPDGSDMTDQRPVT